MDMQYGLSKSQSCLISEISRALDEKAKLKNTIERLCDNLVKLSDEDKNIIKECLAFLVSDLDITDIDMRDTPERFYFDAVKAYLEDGHSIQDLDEIEDDSEVFDYCGI